ncbi:MAG: hypothetical protein GX174_05000 [Lentisphaerae bacterium]|nr:hypothetical protein [Lentisphaerota bacterium]
MPTMPMRASRDEDFGTQLLGRILRVHRLLHGRARAKSLPVPLNYGYVFLADPDTQSGIDKAGQLINQIQTEYAKASTATVAYRVGDATAIASVAPDGQTSFNLVTTPEPPPSIPAVAEGSSGADQPSNFVAKSINLINNLPERDRAREGPVQHLRC